MTLPPRSLLLKIYVGEKYVSRGMPLYEEILWEAKKFHLGGATAVKGLMGLGHIGTMQSTEGGRHNDLPVIIEAIDSPEKIHSFISRVVKMLGNHGLIITMDVNVAHQGVMWPHASLPDDPDLKIKSYD